MNSPHELEAKVQELLDAGDPIAAERIVRERIAAGNNPPAMYLLATCLARQFRYREAVEIFEALTEPLASRADVVANYAAALIDGVGDGVFDDKAVRLERAIGLLRPLVEKEDVDPRIIYNYANGNAAFGDRNESRRQLYRCILRGFAPPELVVNLAHDYHSADRFSESIDLCLEALDAQPGHDMAWASLAAALNKAFYLTGAKLPHLLLLAELACSRSDAAIARDPRSIGIVKAVRDYHRKFGFQVLDSSRISEWTSWFDAMPSVDVPRALRLNLLRNCPHAESWFPELPLISGFTHAMHEAELVPEWFRILNAVQADFDAARDDLLSTRQRQNKGSEYRRHTLFVDCNDLADYSHTTQRMLDCVSRAVNALDKLGLFLKSYFGVEVNAKSVYFGGKTSILRRIPAQSKGIEENLNALRAIADDETSPFIARAYDVRNAITHRYVIVRRQEDEGVSQSVNGLAISSRQLSELARRMLSVTKAAMYHTAGLVAWRDRQAEASAKVALRAQFELM